MVAPSLSLAPGFILENRFFQMNRRGGAGGLHQAAGVSSPRRLSAGRGHSIAADLSGDHLEFITTLPKSGDLRVGHSFGVCTDQV
jgi:hypothetical protein